MGVALVVQIVSNDLTGIVDTESSGLGSTGEADYGKYAVFIEKTFCSRRSDVSSDNFARVVYSVCVLRAESAGTFRAVNNPPLSRNA